MFIPCGSLLQSSKSRRASGCVKKHSELEDFVGYRVILMIVG